jgi:hypothetical protein
MSYTIKNTGGTLNIGQLMDFDGEVVDIAANKAAIQAVWKSDSGDAVSTITVSEGGDDYECKLDMYPSYAVVTGTLDPNAAGTYLRVGLYNGASYFKMINNNFWLESFAFTEEGATYRTWYITSAHGQVSVNGWQVEQEAASGEYAPQGDATGTATVVAIDTGAPFSLLPLGSSTIRLTSSTDAIVPRNIVVDVLTEAAYNNLYSGTDTQALIAAVAVVDGNVDEIETKTDSLITGLNALGSRSLNDLYGSNNQLIP